MSLKSETISLAVMLELPLVVCDVQRAGPSTGMPTKTEQADLSQAMFGRHGEAPLPVIAAQSPGDCFDAAFEACRVAVEYRTPVIVLTDGYLANGAEPWLVPNVAQLPPIEPNFATEPNRPDGDFGPTSATRNWPAAGVPGPGLEHRIGGLEKMDGRSRSATSPTTTRRWCRSGRTRWTDSRFPTSVDDPTGDADCWCSDGAPPGVRSRRPSAGYGRRATAWRTPTCAGSTHSPPTSARTAPIPTRRRARDEHGTTRDAARAKYLVDVERYSRVRGLPISPTELENDLIAMLSEENR